MFASRLRTGCLIVLLILGIVLPTLADAAPPYPQVGDNLPDIRLPVPVDTEHLAYLNPPGTLASIFALSGVSADLVVVQIFSMYCPHCQREAPRVNQLFAALQKRPENAPKIRLLGIGVGNSPMEVGVFRKTYEIAFPLFPDSDFSIHKQLSEVRTPFFLAFRPGDPAPQRLRLAHMGPFEDVAEFAARLGKIAAEAAP